MSRFDTIDMLVKDAKTCLEYLITDKLDPKDGTHHKIQLSVCAEIIQGPLKEVYSLLERMEKCTTLQTTLVLK